MLYTLPLARLIEEFQKLPGVGPKSAQRLAFHVLKQPSEEVQGFADALLRARSQIGFCRTCFHLSAQDICEICQNPQRKAQWLCVVAEPKDLYALERTGEFSGKYHVLHGLISPLEGIGPEQLKIQPLLNRLAAAPKNGAPPIEIEEITLALPPSVEGDTTSLYLTRLLKPLGFKLTRLAYGLPAGADLEYADNLTIMRALQGRQIV